MVKRVHRKKPPPTINQPTVTEAIRAGSPRIKAVVEFISYDSLGCSMVASLNDFNISCPDCGQHDQITMIAPNHLHAHYVAWCPCGTVFVYDSDAKAGQNRTRAVYSFYTNNPPKGGSDESK